MRDGYLLSGATGFGFSVGDGEAAVRLAQGADVALDIETSGLGAAAWNLKAVQIGTTDYAHVLHPVEDRAAIVDSIRGARRLIVHNAPFDIPILYGLGYLGLPEVAKVYDTLVACRLAAPSEHGGHDLQSAYAKFVPDHMLGDKDALARRYREATGKSKSEMYATLSMDSEAYCMYAARDALMAAQLAVVMPALMERHTTDHPFPVSGDPVYLMEREQTINRMMLARSCVGIEIDFDVVDELKAEMRDIAADADAVLAEWGIDCDEKPVKVKQAVMVALDKLGALPSSYPRLSDGRPTADNRYRQHIDNPLVEHLELRARALRFHDDYANKLALLAREGRIRPQVAIAAAVTGRMAMKEPPLQQFPASVRRMMRFDTDATSLDWSSIEPVLAALLFGETGLIEHFEGGGDLYEPVAQAAAVPRKVAKTVLLAQLYGQGVPSLATRLGRDEDSTRRIVADINGYLGRVSAGLRVVRGIGDTHGRIQTISGRIVPIDPDPRAGNHRYYGYRGINYLIQGSAYDVLAEVLMQLHARGLDDAVYVAVHDELVVAADAADEVEQVMRTAPPELAAAAGRKPVLRVGRTELGNHWTAKEG